MQRGANTLDTVVGCHMATSHAHMSTGTLFIPTHHRPTHSSHSVPHTPSTCSSTRPWLGWGRGPTISRTGSGGQGWARQEAAADGSQ